MNNHSAESLPTPATAAFKAVKSGVSTARSAQLLSNVAGGILPLLRNLRPRFLEGLTPPEFNSVLTAAKHRRVPANSVVTNQDHPAEHMYLLLTGRARYFFLTPKGQKVILLWIPPGETFGGASLLATPAEYLVSAETVRNSSMLVWDRATIRSLAARYPKLVENAFSSTFYYLVAYRAAHLALISGTARERLAHVLVSLAKGIGQKVAGGVELKIRNEELANEANITLFTASRLLSEWQRDGMLLKSRGKILLPSAELLLRYAT